METLNLSQTRGYGTGGTVHIVINNQIGFTTSDPRDARSTLYCTDVVKMVEAPIFHVNGDDPEAVVLVTADRARLPHEVRQGRRGRHRLLPQARPQRAGRADGDAAADVQEDRRSIRARASSTPTSWSAQGVIAADEADEMVKDYRARARRAAPHRPDPVLSNYKQQVRGRLDAVPRRASGTSTPTPRVPLGELQRAGRAHHRRCRPNFKLHPRVREDHRRPPAMGAGQAAARLGHGREPGLRVAAGRAATPCASRARTAGAAPSSTATRCCTTRTARSGTQGTYMPLQHIAEKQGDFVVIDSVLSEEAVLGFEYGYATAEPNELVIWEAQFGDFANGAQVVIDQFIASGEVEVGPRLRPDADAAARLRRARARSIPRRASSASCSCAPTTTCRSACRRRRRRSSTCCAGRWCARSASR